MQRQEAVSGVSQLQKERFPQQLLLLLLISSFVLGLMSMLWQQLKLDLSLGLSAHLLLLLLLDLYLLEAV
jgi:hypothetical protein